jgi:hypothetical protein
MPPRSCDPWASSPKIKGFLDASAGSRVDDRIGACQDHPHTYACSSKWGYDPHTSRWTEEARYAPDPALIAKRGDQPR